MSEAAASAIAAGRRDGPSGSDRFIAAPPPPDSSSATPRPRRFSFRRRPLGLRRRILLIFTLGALGLATFLAFTTYGLVRSNVVSQRENDALHRAYGAAGVAEASVRTGLAATAEALGSRGISSYAISYDNLESASEGFSIEDVPESLRNRVLVEGRDAMMNTEFDGEIGITVGIAFADTRGGYFQFFTLDDANDTLANVALSLFLAATITTGLGVLVGVLAARRAVRPVADASEAAKAIAGGRLDTRLTPTEDPDLGVLAQSFNDMAAALQNRVERDARFASDVSHELRSPLMTLSASVEVMETRRDEMPERAQAALDLLVSDVARFRGLVEDLLEISRFDAGAIRLHLEDLQASQFVRNAVAVSSAPTLTITCTPRAERAIIAGDRRRLARVIANLIDNALAYGSGEPEISLEDANAPDEALTHLRIAVADHGPGVPVEERALIFERFARGGSAGRRSGSEGAGLGLALVDEHVRLHDGRVWVEDRTDGEPGARFVIELPAREPIDHVVVDDDDHYDPGLDDSGPAIESRPHPDEEVTP
ncbi:HAMP domain-containing sensor histidine kinase [Desertimonas flava]|uniref:HAMP domain-containing sensor histidine kinase n=1 Tax=Desertimonas flava TaxID=2064846 RepID=UPI000E345ED0|nr:HAMP domain-containing sensor histidine kinase [Desertimonas flava]